MPYLVWAAITKYHSGWLKHQFIYHSSQGWEVQDPDSVSGENPLPGLQMVTFSHYPHMARERKLLPLPLFITTFIPS